MEAIPGGQARLLPSAPATGIGYAEDVFLSGG